MRLKLVIGLGVIYSAAILYLIMKLFDIRINPSKYDIIPGYAHYQQSIYYWRVGREYGKNDIPGMVWPSTFILYFIIPFIWFVNLEQINLIGVEKAIETFSYTHPFVLTAYLIGSLIFAMIVGSYSALYSTRPRDIAFSIFGMNSLFCHPQKIKARVKTWREWTTITLIAFLIAFPIRLWMLGHGGYINESQLQFTTSFGIHTQVYRFDDVNIEVSWNYEENKYDHYWLINSSGERFDLCDPFICFNGDSDFDLIGHVETSINKS